MTRDKHTEILNEMAKAALADVVEAKKAKDAEAKATALGKFRACEEMARKAKLQLSLGDSLIALI